MKRQLTLAQYRNVDLALFAVILSACEYAATLAAKQWFPEQLYTVSLTAALSAIVLMRWGAWGGLHAALGGIVFVLASRGSASQLAIYALGNLGCLLLLPLLKNRGKEKLRGDKLFTALFALGVALTMQLGRAFIALVLGNHWQTCMGFFTTDSLSAVFAMVVVSLARRLDGVFEDQKSYLRRLQERQKKGGF